MNLPRFLSCLFALAVSGGAAAFQVGQLEATSRLGEPLAARIVLHGAGTDDFEKLETRVLPDVGLTAADPAHRVVASITTGYARDTFGQAYVILRTSAPVHEPALSFRVRIGHDGRAVVAHFTLALAPPVSPPVQARSRVAPPIVSRQARPVAIPRAADAVVATGATYGPVRPGDSLWRILRAQGLSTDATIIARIVQDNPHPSPPATLSRLRVGVELILPNRPARTPTPETRRTPSAPAQRRTRKRACQRGAHGGHAARAACAPAHAQPAERPGADATAPAAERRHRSTTAPGCWHPRSLPRPAPVAPTPRPPGSLVGALCHHPRALRRTRQTRATTPHRDHRHDRQRRAHARRDDHAPCAGCHRARSRPPCRPAHRHSPGRPVRAGRRDGNDPAAASATPSPPDGEERRPRARGGDFAQDRETPVARGLDATQSARKRDRLGRGEQRRRGTARGRSSHRPRSICRGTRAARESSPQRPAIPRQTAPRGNPLPRRERALSPRSPTNSCVNIVPTSATRAGTVFAHGPLLTPDRPPFSGPVAITRRRA